jgi:hypothetical protein
LSAIKENIMMFLYTVLISRSLHQPAPATQTKIYFFNFVPQWVTEQKKLNSHSIKQHIDYRSYFKKKPCIRTPAKAAVNLSKSMFSFKPTISDSRTAGLQSVKTLAQDTII